MPRRQSLLGFAKHQFYGYDITTNEFVDKTIPAEKIIGLYNSYVPKCHNKNGIPKITDDIKKAIV